MFFLLNNENTPAMVNIIVTIAKFGNQHLLTWRTRLGNVHKNHSVSHFRHVVKTCSIEFLKKRWKNSV